jgi:hypothetical protein
VVRDGGPGPRPVFGVAYLYSHSRGTAAQTLKLFMNFKSRSRANKYSQIHVKFANGIL